MSQRKKVVTTPCIVCDGKLESTGSGDSNHPSGGIAFTSPGHYGTGAFDPMDGSFLEINICDGCIIGATKKNQVLLNEPIPLMRKKRFKVSYWDGLG